ncbi:MULTISPECIES: hypothetical protein [unclassified Bradyrhizobium]|uniref:hypothetical protein n=1 Tax=unclassified Bradyrhizobium TaxID=2631580 RepID=UPI0020B28961|nr:MULTISPECIES: hypothetical protein [unclassified Bradyrhizobium]MCP3397825.1 hypothetical protein [Bradyrhizobium sp. CCGB20]MCP3406412.1 hypothetical protein [Bradyrhizobium sp. CCGB01]
MNRQPRRSRKKASEVDPTRIGQLLRLALSSNQTGEAVAAIAALKRTLGAAGLDLHDLAGAAERGLQPQYQQQQPRQRGSWGPPEPSLDDWNSMAWWCFHHRYRVPVHQRELVEDLLLGRGEGFANGQICRWAISELRAIVVSVRAALAEARP